MNRLTFKQNLDRDGEWVATLDRRYNAVGPSKDQAVRNLDFWMEQNQNEAWLEAAQVFERYLLSKALIDVMNERIRQQEDEGFTAERDDDYVQGDLAYAAACYAQEAGSEALTGTGDCPVAGWAPEHWPWDRAWWKPKSARENLVKAGALILAEIERLDRKAGEASK